jgi:hypothetical protein
MSIVLQSSGGGQITVNEPVTASNFTQNLPAAAGTVVLTDVAGTLALSATGANIITASTNGAERMRITAAGDVGIGTSIPAFSLDIGSPLANIRVAPSTPTNNALTRYVNTGGTGFVGLDNSVGGLTSAYALNLYHTGAYPIVMSTSGTERMRIDSSGRLLVGTTTISIFNQTSGGGFVTLGNGETYISRQNDTPLWVNRNTSTGGLIQFYYGSAAVGNISTNGAGTSYNTTSDYRLKENIAPMTGALNKVKALNPVTYKWKSDGSDGQGFIAHELQDIVPDAVSGKKDAVDAKGKPQYQGVDTSFLVATLTAAIQEQQALITQLQADVAALKGSK